MPSAAIEAGFLRAVASSDKVASSAHRPIAVKFFAPIDTGLFAVVECTVPIAGGSEVLLELIVGGKGEEKYITLEDISDVSA